MAVLSHRLPSKEDQRKQKDLTLLMMTFAKTKFMRYAMYCGKLYSVEYGVAE